MPAPPRRLSLHASSWFYDTADARAALRADALATDALAIEKSLSGCRSEIDIENMFPRAGHSTRASGAELAPSQNLTDRAADSGRVSESCKLFMFVAQVGDRTRIEVHFTASQVLSLVYIRKAKFERPGRHGAAP